MEDESGGTLLPGKAEIRMRNFHVRERTEVTRGAWWDPVDDRGGAPQKGEEPAPPPPEMQVTYHKGCEGEGCSSGSTASNTGSPCSAGQGGLPLPGAVVLK